MNHQVDKAKSFFPEHGLYRWLLLMVIFLSALAVRLYNADAPPLDFYPVRQYRAAILARALYYESSPQTVPEKIREEALVAKPSPLEPPLMETMVSILYKVFGGENLMYPRLLSIAFWMIAAVFLYRLANELISPDAGIISTTLFLFLPFSVVASRSFQPDPLMIMMFVASIYAIYRYYSTPSNGGLAAVCVLSALAIFVKPVCVFPIFAVFLAMRVPTGGINKILFGRDLILFSAASIAPTFLYYGYGIFISGFLMDQAESSFLPSLYLKPFYWKGWIGMASDVFTKWLIIISLFGVLLAKSESKRYFLAGLWIGYILFGLAFTYHIHNHLYYQLMLIPIVALSLGMLASYIFRELALNKGIWYLGVWVLFVITVSWGIQRSIRLLDDSGFDEQVQAYKEIGEKVNHSSNTIFLDAHEGDRLMYYGRIFGFGWPIKNKVDYSIDDDSKELSGKEILEKIISERSPDYFIITNIPQFEDQEDLKQTLDSEYYLLAESRTRGKAATLLNCDGIRHVIPQVPGGESPDYIIYDLRRKKISD